MRDRDRCRNRNINRNRDGNRDRNKNRDKNRDRNRKKSVADSKPEYEYTKREAQTTMKLCSQAPDTPHINRRRKMAPENNFWRSVA